jgi:hypothetical protein
VENEIKEWPDDGKKIHREGLKYRDKDPPTMRKGVYTAKDLPRSRERLLINNRTGA